jgi:hypothetical protein
MDSGRSEVKIYASRIGGTWDIFEGAPQNGALAPTFRVGALSPTFVGPTARRRYSSPFFSFASTILDRATSIHARFEPSVAYLGTHRLMDAFASHRSWVPGRSISIAYSDGERPWTLPVLSSGRCT